MNLNRPFSITLARRTMMILLRLSLISNKILWWLNINKLLKYCLIVLMAYHNISLLATLLQGSKMKFDWRSDSNNHILFRMPLMWPDWWKIVTSCNADQFLPFDTRICYFLNEYCQFRQQVSLAHLPLQRR